MRTSEPALLRRRLFGKRHPPDRGTFCSWGPIADFRPCSLEFRKRRNSSETSSPLLLANFARYWRSTQISHHFLGRVWPISICASSNIKRRGAMTEQHDDAGGCSTMSQPWPHPTTFYGSGFHPDLMSTKRRIAISASGNSGVLPIKRSRSDTVRTGREGSRPGHRRDEQRALRYSVGENVLHSSASAFRAARDARKDGCFVRSDDCRSTGETAQDLHVLGVAGAGIAK